MFESECYSIAMISQSDETVAFGNSSSFSYDNNNDDDDDDIYGFVLDHSAFQYHKEHMCTKYIFTHLSYSFTGICVEM